MENTESRLYFASDYMEGAHPAIMKKLMETNLEKTVGYGQDPYTEDAKEKIRKACNAPEAEVFLLVGGTQTNATVIDALLKSYQGVVAADTGHIATHESGAIEFGGHKVLTVPQKDGKISAQQIEKLVKDFYDDANYEHMVMPGMVYISQPTEYGTLYSREELAALSKVCRENHLPLYVDGARLAYALASPENDVTLTDLAELSDVFYIGGTKCGALFGEAVVIPQKGRIPHFFTIIKQHGALLAKGRIAGIQFGELFTDGLYLRIGKPAMEAAEQIKDALKKYGYQLSLDTPTNQIFCIVSNEVMKKIAQDVEFGFWEKYDETHSVIRFATSWATTMEDTQKLIQLVVLDKIKYKETSTKYAILFVGNTTKGGIIMLKFQDNNTTVIATFEDFILTAYVIIDELYHQFAPPEVTRRRHILNAKLSDSEIITISLCGELAGVDSENAWFSFVKRNYRHLFPQLCSRSRFNRTRRALMQTTELLRQKMISVFPIPVSSYYIVDSFPLAVCKFGRARYCKAFRGHGADYGKCPSKKETYYGYKVHALITLEGYIASFEITPASTDDREGLRDLADHWSNVTILADKGYVGKNMKQEMQEKNICLFALKRSNSKENWPKSVRQLIFKLRRRVETVFSQLSGQLNAERVLAKSFQGLCTRLVNKVLAYNLCIALNSIFGETCELGKIKKLIF